MCVCVRVHKAYCAGSIGVILGICWFVYRAFWHLELEQIGDRMPLHALVVYIILLVAISLCIGLALVFQRTWIVSAALFAHAVLFSYIEGSAFNGEVYPGALVLLTSVAGFFGVGRFRR
jgi:hypothetical protein